MKKASRLLGIAAGIAAVMCFALANCGNNSSPPAPEIKVTVSFNLGGFEGEAIPSITVTQGTAAGNKWPRNPVWLTKNFEGWFDGETPAVLYSAATPITKDITVTAQWSAEVPGLENQPDEAELEALFDTDEGFPAALSNSWKIWGHHNAIITHGFGADPTVMPYKDRVYIYASNDSLGYSDLETGVPNPGGAPNQNVGYNAGIRGIRVVSSADLVNWTDHGLINVGNLPSTWEDPLNPKGDPVTPFETRSWAPSAVWKNIGGKDKFFIYFANGGNGIGVISADSPTGPWTSPLNKLLIDRNTPNCATVEYLFDPGVMVDDEDGRAYMYFGGGGSGLDSGNGRRVRLGNDMISLAGTPQTWTSPCLFEDNEITKINGMYYYSYVTNGTSNAFGLQSTQIAYRTSWEALGDYSDPKGIMASPQTFFSTQDQNNHHCIFVFKNQPYIAYHASRVAQAMGLGRYRSTQIDKLTINAQGVISTVTMTRKGVDQVGKFNPYAQNEAETIGIMGGVYTRPDAGAGNGMVVTSIDTGDWLALYGVDFGSVGANKITVRVRMPTTPANYVGAIELRLDPAGDGVTSDTANLSATQTARIKDGTVAGRIQLKAKSGEEGKYTSVTVDLDSAITGVHDLVFVFYSSLGVKPETVNPDSRHKNGFEFDQWQFLN
jgi:arabinoxylan arabinofuranohydrolase